MVAFRTRTVSTGVSAMGRRIDMKRVFTCTNFEGFFPVGTAAVIVAEDAYEARQTLQSRLVALGLGRDCHDRYDIEEVDTSDSRPAHAIILRDGDY